MRNDRRGTAIVFVFALLACMLPGAAVGAQAPSAAPVARGGGAPRLVQAAIAMHTSVRREAVHRGPRGDVERPQRL